MQFLKINELMENHRTAALGHGSLSRNIRLQLSLPRAERKKEGLVLVEECKMEYDRLLEQSPSIPRHILTNSDKEYPIEGVFTKPEILNVLAIPPLKPPKTIGTVQAITKGTPFEKFVPSEDEEEVEYEEEEEIDVEQGTSTDRT